MGWCPGKPLPRVSLGQGRSPILNGLYDITSLIEVGNKDKHREHVRHLNDRDTERVLHREKAINDNRTHEWKGSGSIRRAEGIRQRFLKYAREPLISGGGKHAAE